MNEDICKNGPVLTRTSNKEIFLGKTVFLCRQGHNNLFKAKGAMVLDVAEVEVFICRFNTLNKNILATTQCFV